MRTIRRIGMALMAVVIGCTLSACGDEEEEDNSDYVSHGTMTVDGKDSFNFSYCSYLGVNYGGDVAYLIFNFLDYDPRLADVVPDHTSTMGLQIPMPSDWGIGTHYEIAPADYIVSAAIDYFSGDPSYTFVIKNPATALSDTKLIIDRDRSVYTFTLENVAVKGVYEGDTSQEDHLNHSLSLSFKGTITEMEPSH